MSQLTINQGQSHTLKFTADLASLPDESPIKDDGLETSGFIFRFVAIAKLGATTPLIDKSSTNPDEVEIISSTVAQIYLLPEDSNAIAISGGKSSVSLLWGLQFSNSTSGFIDIPEWASTLTIRKTVFSSLV